MAKVDRGGHVFRGWIRLEDYEWQAWCGEMFRAMQFHGPSFREDLKGVTCGECRRRLLTYARRKRALYERIVRTLEGVGDGDGGMRAL